MKTFTIFLIISLFCLQIQIAFAFQEKVDGLEYVVRKINNPPLDKTILKRFDLYELYFENSSDKAFSIPGYSINLGVDYSGVEDVLSINKDKASKKLTVLNIATGAASIAFGGLAKSAANTAYRSINSFKKNNSNLNSEKSFLSGNKTYIIYPSESLSLFFLIDKLASEAPSSIRYICHDEVQDLNFVVINKNLDLREINAGNKNPENMSMDESGENVIAVPNSNDYR